MIIVVFIAYFSSSLYAQAFTHAFPRSFFIHAFTFAIWWYIYELKNIQSHLRKWKFILSMHFFPKCRFAVIWPWLVTKGQMVGFLRGINFVRCFIDGSLGLNFWTLLMTFMNDLHGLRGNHLLDAHLPCCISVAVGLSNLKIRISFQVLKLRKERIFIDKIQNS